MADFKLYCRGVSYALVSEYRRKFRRYFRVIRHWSWVGS